MTAMGKKRRNDEGWCGGGLVLAALAMVCLLSHTSQRWYLPLGNALMLANSLRRCCSAALSRTLLSRQRVHNL